VSPQSIVIEMAGSEAKIDGLLDVLRPYGVLEMVRTGRVAMSRGVGRGRPGAAGPAAAIPDSETGVSYSV
jgi:acetolactate synthase I/III small subunit